MHKYDVWFCHCGRIHVMPNEYYEWLQEDYKNRFILRICQNCGNILKIWLDEYDDGYSINSTSISNIEFSENELKNCKIITNYGIRVPMKDSFYAVHFMSGTFLSEFGFTTVDTKKLINEVKDKDILASIAAYAVNINWDNTEYKE